jgi:ribose transport system permease protein
VSRVAPPELLGQLPARPQRRLMALVGPLLGLALIIFAGGITEYFKEGTLNYWSPQNQCLILTQTVTVMAGAIGMTMIIISGGIDLSCGSLIALASVSAAWLVRYFAPPDVARLAGPEALWLPALALAGGVLVGAAAGTTNGLLITRLRLVPFIVTLGMMSFARGAAKGIAKQQRIDAPVNWISEFTGFNITLADFRWDWGPFSWRGPVATSTAVVVTLVLAAAIALMLTRTRFGRHIFAIGSNEATARLCGVHVERTKLWMYGLAGSFFGLGGIVDYGRLTVGDPTTAMGKELDIIAAVVIGGGSLNGGVGSVAGSLIGALLMAQLRNICARLDLQNFWQEIVIGIVLVVAVKVDQIRQKRRG